MTIDNVWAQSALLMVVGLVAGTINTVAGGGSLISLPMLVFVGLPADVANATNRIGVLLQSSMSTYRFRAAGALQVKPQIWLLGVTMMGSAVGAFVSVQLEEVVLRRILGGIMLLVLVMTWLDPKRWLEGTGRPAHRVLQALGFFAIGAYGGLIQAGVGLLLLMGGVLLSGVNVVRANAFKNLAVLVFTVPAIAIFLWHDVVAWQPGLSLAVGSLAGGHFGAQLALKVGPNILRGILGAIALLGAGYLLLG